MAVGGVIFDMDGVLLDSEPVYREASRRALATMGCGITDSQYADLIGLPGPDVLTALSSLLGSKFIADNFRNDFMAHWQQLVTAEGLPVKPGVHDTLAELTAHQIPFAVATSTPRERAWRSLRAGGLDASVPLLVGGDEVSRGKPAPDIFLAAASRIAVPPGSCIVIEDSAAGITGAVAAGMRAWMVPDLKQPDASLRQRCHAVWPSLHDALPALLAACRDGHFEPAVS
ncbi:MAG: HAD family phosphatase [Gammaproteobacteria bacterium]|nr:HAD family phosphatase [Gammaproteobacteria bacterium]